MNPSEQYGLERLLRKLDTQPNTVKWGDLISSPENRHTSRERDLALQTGTASNQGNPADLYRGWQRPWLFWTALKLGAILIALSLAGTYGSLMLVQTTTEGAVQMLYLIPPMVIPLVLMVFFWELNVPRNITIWELLLFFLVGAILSFAGNGVMYRVVRSGPDSYAALREEPAKLFAGVILMIYFSKAKHKRIFGLTGLVIGAAVGSGFSAFESINYGLKNDLYTVVVRVAYAAVGHTMYSCSYTAAAALHSPDGRITPESFFNSDFLLTFMGATACHALWNTGEIPVFVKLPIAAVVLWYEALWMTRKCLVQVRHHRSGTSPNAAAPRMCQAESNQIMIRCLRGEIAGKQWTLNGGALLGIGRGAGNAVRIPDGIAGISRMHCYLEKQPTGWFVMDANSTHGTYLQEPGGRICRLAPGKQYPINNGSLIFLGSQKFCIGVTLL